MHDRTTRSNIPCSISLYRSKKVTKSTCSNAALVIALFASLCIHSVTTLAQTGTATMNGTVQATTVQANTITGLNTNGTLTVDGTTYTKVNQVLAANPFFAGTINYLNLPQTNIWDTDPILNTASIGQPAVSVVIPGCSSGTNRDSAASPLAHQKVTVQLVEYDNLGNSVWASVNTTGSTGLSTTDCVSVATPTQLGGNFTWMAFASSCADSNMQCSGPYYLQISINGQVSFTDFSNPQLFNFTTSGYARCATNSPNTVINAAWECGATPPPSNPGLVMQNIRINLQGGTYSTAVPVTVPSNGAITGVARHATQIQMDPTFPKGIPCPMEPYGIPVSGGALTANQQITVQYAYLDRAGNSLNVTCASMPTTLPPAPATCSSGKCQYQYLNPSPPLIVAPWHANMRQWSSLSGLQTGGSRITDCDGTNYPATCSNPTSVWVMCGLAGETCGTHKNVSAVTGSAYPNFFPSGVSACSTVGSSFVDDPVGGPGVRWLCIMKGQNWSAGTVNAGTEVWDNTTHAFHEQLKTPSCTAANPSPTFSSAFAGVVIPAEMAVCG
jgi:hypothetical protein